MSVSIINRHLIFNYKNHEKLYQKGPFAFIGSDIWVGNACSRCRSKKVQKQE